MRAAREPAGHEPRAAQKALALLEAAAQLGSGATAKEISQLTGIPPTTAYRLLNMLVADGFLVRVADLSGFALGRRTRELADAVVDTAPASPQLIPATVLEELRARVRHAVVVVSYAGDRVRIVDRDPDHELSHEHAIRTHLHASAVGKLLLARRPELASAASLRPLTAHTIIAPDALAAQLRAICDGAPARERDEVKIGRSALAVPILDAGEAVGAVAAIGRTGRLDVHDRELTELLQRSATARDPATVSSR